MHRLVLVLVLALLCSVGVSARADQPSSAPISVWVVGDSTAQPLEQGFTALHKEDGRLKVRTLFKNSSGLIRKDVIDWFKTMREQLLTSAPRVAVLTFGPNDAQGIIVRGKRSPVELGTEEWREEYAKRVRAFADLFLARGATVYLLLQPFDETKKHAPLMRAVNAALREAVTLDGGVPGRLFSIDVPNWIESGVQERAAAATSEKKPTPLKNADGIHLTFAGGKYLSRQLTEQIVADATRAESK